MISNSNLNEYITISESEMALRCCGVLILFDTDDYAKISQHQWSVGSHGYAVSGSGKSQILMHRLVMSASGKEQVDHINRVKVDNRKRNLRICSASQNGCNRLAQSNSATGHKGICRLPNGRYQVQVVSNGKPIYLGTYASIDEAVHISESAQFAIAGDFAAITTDVALLDKEVFRRLELIRHRRRMTADQRNKATELHKSGLKSKQIAAEIGFSQSAVNRLLSGITYKNGGKRNNA